MDGITLAVVIGCVIGVVSATLCAVASDVDDDMERIAFIVTHTDDGIVGHSTCDRCGRKVELNNNYCPWCGAKFEGVRRC